MVANPLEFRKEEFRAMYISPFSMVFWHLEQVSLFLAFRRTVILCEAIITTKKLQKKEVS
jgi:hypothetical protein